MMRKASTPFTGELFHCLGRDGSWNTVRCYYVNCLVNFCRNLFQKLAREEVEAGLSDSDEEIPSFGDSLSGYDDVRNKFFVSD